MASVGILLQISFNHPFGIDYYIFQAVKFRQKAYTLLLSSYFLKAEGSESSSVSGNLPCQCSRQDADSIFKIGILFWGNPELKVFLRGHSRSGSLLVKGHLYAFRLDCKSHAERRELPTPRRKFETSWSQWECLGKYVLRGNLGKSSF